jgi:hypothetical protein
MSERIQLQEATAVALEAENRALRAEGRVSECEAAIGELRARFEQLLRRAESQEAELAEVHHEAIAANARCDTLAAELRQRDADSAERDRTAVLHNGGAMAYLGLRVSSARDAASGAIVGGSVAVDEVRAAAEAAGIRAGDHLVSIAAHAEWPIGSVDAYRQCVMDLPLTSTVVAVVRRDAEEFRVEMQPERLALPTGNDGS